MARLSILLTILIICVIGTQGRIKIPNHFNSNVNPNRYNRRNSISDINGNTFASQGGDNSPSEDNTVDSNAEDRGGVMRQYQDDNDLRRFSATARTTTTTTMRPNGMWKKSKSLRSHKKSHSHLHWNEINVKDIVDTLISNFGNDLTDRKIDLISDAVSKIISKSQRPNKINYNYKSNSYTFGSGRYQKKLKQIDENDINSDGVNLMPQNYPVPENDSDEPENLRDGDSNVNSNANIFKSFSNDDDDDDQRTALRLSSSLSGGLRGTRSSRKRPKGNHNYNFNKNVFWRDDSDNSPDLDDDDDENQRRSSARTINRNENSNMFHRRNENDNVN